MNVPPGDSMAGRYVAMLRRGEMDVVLVSAAWVDERGVDCVRYEVLSGPDKGRKFVAAYLACSVVVFGTERACRRRFGGWSHMKEAA